MKNTGRQKSACVPHMVVCVYISLGSGLIEGAPMDTASVSSEYASLSTQFFHHVCSFC